VLRYFAYLHIEIIFKDLYAIDEFYLLDFIVSVSISMRFLHL